VNAPKWIDDTKYSIIAKTTTAVSGSGAAMNVDIDDLKAMVRALITERFRLKTHYEDRPVTAYTLISDKPKLTKADPANRTGWKERPGSFSPEWFSIGPAEVTSPTNTIAAFSSAVQGGGVFLGLLIIVLSSFVVVDSGHIGVVTVFGNVEKVPLYNGLHFVLPYKDVIRMDTRVQKHEARYDAASVDIQAVHAVMALNYRLIDDRAPEVYRTVGLRYEQSIIDPAAAEVLKANTAVHAANDILQQRPRIKADVQDGLTKWLLKYGIQVTEVSIKDIRFDKDFEQAVERKQIAQQVAEQKRYEVDQAKREAESKVARERGEGAALQARAEGEAAALRLRAAAEAEYNAKVTQSLTATLIQQQYLAKWDGKLPQFVTGSGSNLLMQIPTPGR
jgi:regulator of protease activity HflC (stomatin/prohibitin superfamily)